MNATALLRRQARTLEEMAARFRRGEVTAGISESMLFAEQLETIRGEILDAVVKLEREQ